MPLGTLLMRSSTRCVCGPGTVPSLLKIVHPKKQKVRFVAGTGNSDSEVPSADSRPSFNATGLPSQRNRSPADNAFRFKHVAFYQGLKSKVGLVAA